LALGSWLIASALIAVRATAAPPIAESVPTATTAPAGEKRENPRAATAGPAARPLALRVTLSPEWAYRRFRDAEPSSATKYYTASGVAAASMRFELYPLALARSVPDPLKDIGVTANYARALGFESRDPDKPDQPRVDTQWYQFGFGLRYRALGDHAPLAVGVTAGVQRSVFDFGTNPANVPVAIGRYTLLPLGADVRYAWGAFSLFADVRFLLPVTISPLDDRSPSGARYGLQAAVAAALRLSSLFEIELRTSHAMIGYSLPNALVGAHGDASILDQALVFGAGASFLY